MTGGQVNELKSFLPCFYRATTLELEREEIEKLTKESRQVSF